MSKKSCTFAVQSKSKGNEEKNILKKCDKNFVDKNKSITFVPTNNN